ncbi:MAG: DUF1648 domain-containing protein [Firmicutes bacterium]|nr:DUF1648 domain-containing protein [Bacillota bacterium]
MKSNLFDKITAMLSILILLAATLFVILHWGEMPEQIPSHYNFKGEVDDYGGKGILVFTLVMGWVMLLTFWIVGMFPKYWNTGVERTPANEAAVNRIIRDMMSVMQIFLAVMFSYMSVTPALGVNMGRWFTPVFLLAIFGTIIVTVVRLIRNR